MRCSSILLPCGVLGLLACSHATAPAHQAPAPTPARQDTSRAGGGRQQAPDATALKPYNQVITHGAITDSGVFIVHRIGEKLFYEIPRAELDKDFLLVVDYAGTPEGTRYGGENLDNRVVVWQRVGTRVLLRGKSYDIVAY